MAPENAPCRLLVEGNDDKHSMIHLLQRHGADWDKPTPGLPYVLAREGYERVLASIGVSAKSIPKLGIVLDANDDPMRRWAQVKNRLDEEGIELPDDPQQDGVVVEGIRSTSRVGVWLMPDNSRAGALEDFVVSLVPDEDPCWPYADEVTLEAARRGAEFPERLRLKAKIHTWLAWQKEPGRPYGAAINAHYFGHDSEVALRFVKWFKRLFEVA